MEPEEKGSLRISGTGEAKGGVYEEVVISGAGRISGDVEAQRFRVSGVGKFRGKVRGGSFGCSGSCTVEGDVDVKQLECSGSAHIRGSVTSEQLSTSGMITVDGEVRSGEARTTGSAHFGRNVEVGVFESRGSFSIAGKLRADDVRIALGGDSGAGEIEGKQITVVQYGGRKSWLAWFSGPGTLKTESLAGDEIYLEAVRATTVRGERVTVGPDCEIGTLEYRESLRVDPTARTAKHRYIGEASVPPAVETRTVARPEGWARQVGFGVGRFDLLGIRNPVLRVLAALLGLVAAALVVGLVLSIVLPAVGLVLSLVIGLVVAVMLLVVIVVPLAVVAAIVFRGGRR